MDGKVGQAAQDPMFYISGKPEIHTLLAGKQNVELDCLPPHQAGISLVLCPSHYMNRPFHLLVPLHVVMYITYHSYLGRYNTYLGMYLML